MFSPIGKKKKKCTKISFCPSILKSQVHYKPQRFSAKGGCEPHTFILILICSQFRKFRGFWQMRLLTFLCPPLSIIKLIVRTERYLTFRFWVPRSGAGAPVHWCISLLQIRYCWCRLLMKSIWIIAAFLAFLKLQTWPRTSLIFILRIENFFT